MKTFTILFVLFSLIVAVAGCSFTSVSEDQLNNPMDPECPYFVGYDEAAVIYARAAEVNEPVALEEAASKFESKAVLSTGDTARHYKKTAYLLREWAKRIRDNWDPTP